MAGLIAFCGHRRADLTCRFAVSVSPCGLVCCGNISDDCGAPAGLDSGFSVDDAACRSNSGQEQKGFRALWSHLQNSLIPSGQSLFGSEYIFSALCEFKFEVLLVFQLSKTWTLL